MPRGSERPSCSAEEERERERQIRRLTATNQTHHPITTAAETALIDLLVDTHSAEAVDAWDDGFPPSPRPQTDNNEPQGDCQPAAKRARGSNSIHPAAAAAARQLTSLGHGQLSAYNRPLSYNSVEPHVAAIIRWLGTLSNDIGTHLQLPPVLASLRGILNAILEQQTSTATWAAMIEVGEALEELIHGGHLVHHSDVVALDVGGHDTDLALRTQDEARGNEFIETLTALLETVDSLPRGNLPAAREAAMRLGAPRGSPHARCGGLRSRGGRGGILVAP